MSIIIRKPGILSTVQDLGRPGYARLGINRGGAMDRAATRIVNSLLNNHEGEAVIEMHYPAAVISFDQEAFFAIGGGNFGATLDGEPVGNWRVHRASSGSILKFAERISGNRTYLAVRGGFAVDQWLGSGSTNLAAAIGGVEGRPLKAGDRIDLGFVPASASYRYDRYVSPELIPRYSRFPTVRIIFGDEFSLLEKSSRSKFTDQNYTVSPQSDRMGFRLLAEPLRLGQPLEMISAAAAFGTIQLLPDGQLAILMADHQTSGGYPRLGNVIAADLPLLAQLGPGDKAAFHSVTLAEAEEIDLGFERDMEIFKIGCRY